MIQEFMAQIYEMRIRVEELRSLVDSTTMKQFDVIEQTHEQLLQQQAERKADVERMKAFIKMSSQEQARNSELLKAFLRASAENDRSRRSINDEEELTEISNR